MDSTKKAAGSGSSRLWGALLVADAFLIAIFGGTLASKIYQYRSFHPSPDDYFPSLRRLPPQKPLLRPPAVLAKAPQEAPAAAKPPAPAKAKEEAPAPRASGAERESAKPASRPRSPEKAVPQVFSITAPRARSVYLVGSFLVRSHGKIKMRRVGHGRWAAQVYLTPNTYRYLFMVDGATLRDPGNSETDHGYSVRAVRE